MSPESFRLSAGWLCLIIGADFQYKSRFFTNHPCFLLSHTGTSNVGGWDKKSKAAKSFLLQFAIRFDGCLARLFHATCGKCSGMVSAELLREACWDPCKKRTSLENTRICGVM